MTLIVDDATGAAGAANPSISTEQRAEDRRISKERIPLSTPQRKLEVPEIEGFHCHWINDYPGRVPQALRAGYTFVEDAEVNLNDFTLASAAATSGNADLGTRVSLVVGKNEDGRPLFAFLMKIPSQLYQEDQSVIQDRVNARDRQIKGGKIGIEQDGDPSKRYVRSDYKPNTRRA